jgi:hypothetical protein
MLVPVKEACILQDNALDIRISDQIEQLDELITTEGSGEEFFARTHFTQGLQTLVVEGVARLAGKSSQAVFHLKQAMGGGKTHLLIGLGLLARNQALRSQICPQVLYIRDFDSAKIAAFNGRNSPNHFFWGEIAQQLGKAEQFREFWAGGPKAPDERDWLRLFDSGEPILILLDEMPPYFHYLDTQRVGNGTVADIATRAFANMLTAAGKKANICVVVSDLTATYDTGSRLINRALDAARQELGRQESEITPVNLESNEVYEILRKRLFKSLPSREVIDEIAAVYGRVLGEAAKAKVVSRSAEAIADEVAQTYPFHPRFKNLVALFKENEQFKQTRGLMELASRLLKSVWEHPGHDIFLIGPQHFNLAIPEVREKLAEISEMRDVIAKDLWDANYSAFAQVVDLGKGTNAAAQVGALLLTASLSTAVNAVKGLTREEMVECLTTPLRPPSEFMAAFDELEDQAWYIHHTPEERYYFDRQENLKKLLQSLAADAPEPQIDGLIRNRLKEMFAAVRKTAYNDVLPLPELSDVAQRVRHGCVLLIVSPDSKLPPEEVQSFFESLTQKNNLCILTGDKTQMASIDKAARQLFAASKAALRITETHPQHDDLQRKQEQYEQDFTAIVLNLFDKVFFPVHLPGREPQLRSKPLDMTRNAKQPFNGEEQIIKTLTSNPLKLYLDVEAEFDAIRDKAQDLLWPENMNEARWADILDRMAEQAGMPWLPPKGIEQVKMIACNRGLWEDLGNGYLTKQPQKKKTSVQVIAETEPDDNGYVSLRINPQNAGPAPKIYYAQGDHPTETDNVLGDQTLRTNALRVVFLVRDPSDQYETGELVVWTNKLVIRNELLDERPERKVKLLVAPQGDLRYTLDGSEPREGKLYQQPFFIGDEDVLVRVFANAEGLESKADFRFPSRGKKGVQIDETKPARLAAARGLKKLDSRAKTYAALNMAAERNITFEAVNLTIGQGDKSVSIVTGGFEASADYLEALLTTALEKFEPTEPISMSFRKARFASGHDLIAFRDVLGLELGAGEVEQ